MKNIFKDMGLYQKENLKIKIMKKTFCLCFGFHLVSWFMKKSLSFFNDAKIRQKY